MHVIQAKIDSKPTQASVYNNDILFIVLLSDELVIPGTHSDTSERAQLATLKILPDIIEVWSSGTVRFHLKIKLSFPVRYCSNQFHHYSIVENRLTFRY